MIERILDLMKKNNITANKLTIELKLPSSAISEWKKGKAKPSTDALVKLSQYFNVSTDYLLTGKEPQNQPQNDLTDDEIELLSTYRKLPLKGKTMTRAYIYNYLDREDQLPPVQIAAYSGSQYENAPQPDLKKQKKALEKYDKN